jgi:hypothetical protein
LEVTEDLVRNPKEALENLINTFQEDQRAEIRLIKEFEQSFEAEHGMKIVFDNSAVQYLISKSRTDQVSAETLCGEILYSFEHGLKLISQNTGRSEFLITEDILVHPRQSLEKMVKESYSSEEATRH